VDPKHGHARGQGIQLSHCLILRHTSRLKFSDDHRTAIAGDRRIVFLINTTQQAVFKTINQLYFKLRVELIKIGHIQLPLALADLLQRHSAETSPSIRQALIDEENTAVIILKCREQ